MDDLEITVCDDSLSLQCGGVHSDVNLKRFSFQERDELRVASGKVSHIKEFRTPRTEEVLTHYGKCSAAAEIYRQAEPKFHDAIRKYQDYMLAGVAAIGTGGMSGNPLISAAGLGVGLCIIIATQKSYEKALYGRMAIENAFSSRL